ncbi:sodium-independent sulfate anion transporter-like [Anthonomus grandis grandis]|uniref:sodium-independent sulfate anion transporter-like n=1 Tax=Anthonomus grandis grandis TaxID=2921223 RepID=UPI002165D960|nr:sodium-independent sulfate anion transporter-like [Anthonomus grandis grandis]
MIEKILDPPEEVSLTRKIQKTLFKRIKILEWLPHYSRGDIIADFIAGLTVGMTMIPQSVAYAGLAGLKPQYGLYTAFIGSFTYVFVGSIKEVSIGPTSLMALLTFSYVVGKPIECVILLTFLAGCIELAMGLFKLGFLVDFISPCLTSGFTSATSIIIIVSQLKGFLGIQVKNHSTFPAIQEICGKLGDIKFPDTLLGVFCVVFLLAIKQLNKVKTSTPFTKKLLWFISISKNALVVFSCSLMAYIWYTTRGSTPFKLTGPVPSGLPEIGPPPFTSQSTNQTMTFVDMISSLGSGIIVVPVVAVLANVAIAKAYSSEAIVDASQEMISLGLCNIFGSFVKAMPSCGAFTRSSVASSSGVRTPLQGVYSGTVIILALSFLAPYFFYIPKATLSAVLIVAASSLVDYQIFFILWKCNKIDFLMTSMTFIFGVMVSVELSIVIGAICNTFIMLKAWSRPKVIVEPRFTLNGLEYLYIMPELGLFYPAADYLSECIKKGHMKYPNLPIALDCMGVLQVDYSATKTIEALAKTYNKNRVGILFINVNQRVLKTLSTILPEEYLGLCLSDDGVDAKGFSVRDVEAEEELLIKNDNLERFSHNNDPRKGSLVEVE